MPGVKPRRVPVGSGIVPLPYQVNAKGTDKLRRETAPPRNVAGQLRGIHCFGGSHVPVTTQIEKRNSLTIRFPDGIGIEVAHGFDEALLSAVVQVLREAPRC